MRNISLLMLLVFCSNFLFSQKNVVGKPKALSDVFAYDLVFDYSGIEIPKFETEEVFLEKKIEKLEETKTGSGEEFKKSWFLNRKERFEPRFIESFNKRFDNKEIVVGENSAKYTIKVHTIWMYPGYGVFATTHYRAALTADIYIYKKSEPENIILKMTYKRMPGGSPLGVDFYSGYRITECYAKLAKELARYMKKKVL
ncbi:hypothetical protein [Aquimarina sp. I32.4]|uniref:hypothetical protein n=1 Tax=Aquimarina sp. I32.4 TaxID=2053903 RepID=UPI0011AF0DC9|nr:hypothetical protein [Aquimarina sp. I32.4]